MSEMPDTYIKRSYRGVTGFASAGPVVALRTPTPTTSMDASAKSVLLRRFDEYTPGDGEIEFMVCERIDDEHAHHVVARSFFDFDMALGYLFECPAGYYIVAVRP